MEDSQIVELYLNRDENAIRETDIKYQKYCYSIAYNILHNIEDANEIVNDTYWGAWSSIPPNVPKVLSTFLGKITRNISLKKLRTVNSAKRRNEEVNIIFDEISDCISSKQNIENEIEAKELSLFINHFLYSLSETERSVFVCRYWYFDSISDISEHSGFSQSKVKSMLFRIRNKLHKKLKEGDFL